MKASKSKATKAAQKSGNQALVINGYAACKAACVEHLNVTANRNTELALVTGKALAVENAKLKDATPAVLTVFCNSVAKKLGEDKELIALADKAGIKSWRNQARVIAQSAVAMIVKPEVTFTALRSNTAKSGEAAVKAGCAASAGIAFLRSDGKLDPRATNRKAAPKQAALRGKAATNSAAKVPAVKAPAARRLSPAMIVLANKIGDANALISAKAKARKVSEADRIKALEARIVEVSKAWSAVSREWDTFRTKYAVTC